jgi:hypothetical protein
MIRTTARWMEVLRNQAEWATNPDWVASNGLRGDPQQAANMFAAAADFIATLPAEDQDGFGLAFGRLMFGSDDHLDADDPDDEEGTP